MTVSIRGPQANHPAPHSHWGRPCPTTSTPVSPDDLADALAFALKFEGRKRVHYADDFMSQIVARRLVRHLERAGFVVMKRPPIGGRCGARARLRDSRVENIQDRDH